MVSSLNITLGLFKHMGKDLNDRLDGVNIAELRVEQTSLDGRDIFRVNSVEGLVCEYDVRDIQNNLPLIERPDDLDIPVLERALLLNSECNTLAKEKQLLRDTLMKIIELKNDGAIQFLSEDDFRAILKAYNQTVTTTVQCQS